MSQDSRENFGVKTQLSIGMGREGEGKTGAWGRKREKIC